MYSDIKSEINAVLRYYDLGELQGYFKNELGFVNTAFAIDMMANGEQKRYFLRKYKQGIREEEILFEHSLIEHLSATQTCPVARLQKTINGKTYLRQTAGVRGEEIFYAIFDFLPGEDRYTWVNPRCQEREIENAAIVLAQFHNAAGTFQPLGGRGEPKIVDLLPGIAETWATCLKKSKRTTFDRFLSDNYELVALNIAATRAALDQPDLSQLPQIVVHCDYHPGNLKFENDRITGLFDFDWSKIDLRSFDVALAIWYFFTSWGEPDDGHPRLDEVGAFLSAYQNYLRENTGVGVLSVAELLFLPALINASNLYVLNWTILDFYNKEVDPEEYLVFLRHSVNFTAWYEEANNREALELVCRGVGHGS